MKQLEGRDLDDLEAAELQPINLGMPVLKHIGAKWLVEMAEYISDNPQFIANGFIRSRIPGAIEGIEDKTESHSNSTSDEDSSDPSEEESTAF